MSPIADDGSPHEDNSQPENDGEGTQPQKSKTGKNIKKNLGKGKKKSYTQKADVAQTLEANGPLDKNQVAELSHNSEQEHFGQGDAPVNN